MESTNFKKLFIASKNSGKIDEFRQILSKFNISIESAGSIESQEIEETGSTFIENAKIKAEYFSDIIDEKTAIIADDSGLCVDFLNGAPGINSARYAPNRDFDVAIGQILSALKNAKDNERQAHFSCALYLIAPNGTHHIFEGQINGTITKEKRGKGFGYDPIFLPNGHNKTFGEMTKDEKNTISHRGLALSKFTSWLENCNSKSCS